jgi:L,D-peptidoglycan transpeptidase YkuD (ErfK/YbiS/YcfS/YnhG family)
MLREPRLFHRRATFRCRLILVAFMIVWDGHAALAGLCDALHNARRLALVAAPMMNSSSGTLQLFARPTVRTAWRPQGAPIPVTLGTAGLAWGAGFRDLASDGEPLKVEGDKRTPAGIYRIGRSFGFAPSARRNYLRLTATSVCVDDPSAAAYNTITSRTLVGPRVRGEDMRRISAYRRGLVIDYPVDAAHRAGSCIFVHIWRGPASRTLGCVAASEGAVAILQYHAAQARMAIAILPNTARSRLSSCLPSPPNN